VPRSPIPGVSHRGATKRPSSNLNDGDAKAAPDEVSDNVPVVSNGKSSGSETKVYDSKWARTTEQLTTFSMVPFLFLNMPQVWKNWLHMLAGNTAAVGIISWTGYTSGMLGNLLLFSYFAAKGERGATLVQAVGVISTAVLLIQVFIAGFFPASFFWPLAFIIVCGVTMGSLRLLGLLGERIWAAWQSALGIIGLATLPQSLWSMFCPNNMSYVPALAGGLAGGLLLYLDKRKLLPHRWSDLRSTLSAWTATLLFMLMPVPQLMNNFSNPMSVHGLSALSVVLGMCGNSLMIPRALLTRDVIWFTGTTWGAIAMGWAQLLSIYLGNAMHNVTFALLTCAFLGFISLVFIQDAREFKLSSPYQSFKQMIRKKTAD